MYKIIAQLNKILLPSFSKKQLDLSHAKKWQKAVLAWRYYITCKALKD